MKGIKENVCIYKKVYVILQSNWLINMAKKNKFKRNKSDIPSNIFNDGGIITDMYT